ncbi:MAG: hypothetical protein Q8P59_00645, partial [Dehalococcoidia bacterium]|nr:hypothetical protein [Dehalococcoidia bacterium]
MFDNLIQQIGYQGLFYAGLAAIPIIILGHYLGLALAPLAKKLTAKAKLAWLRWQKRGQFAHYTKETLERYRFAELYDVTKASLAVADFRTAEHILIHLLARPEAGQQPDLHQLLGQIYHHYGNLSKAKLVCQQGIRAYPMFYDTYPLLG